MLFNSWQFLIFFPTVVILFFALPGRYRQALLLLASYYFYMCWKAEYLFLILVSTLIDYTAGILMGKTERLARRRLYLILSLLTNLGLLFTFKYFNFFNDSFRLLFRHFNLIYHVPALKVLLPVGISFYTFQTLSYTIDVYRGKKEPERNLVVFALYVAFFPQLVAGPIERSTRLLPQFYEKMEFDYERVKNGLLLMVWGFFKKVVIADRLAIYVNQVYGSPGDFSGPVLLLATYFFAFQIYCDFSGYSDIAIGAAQVMGYRLMLNFNRPYFSKSISEFWKRWHISLSSWFRDYLYIPLGGNRVARWRWYANLFIVFLVSGLWHGANWTFVVWGGLHGSYLLISIWTDGFRAFVRRKIGLEKHPALKKAIRVAVTFHLVLFSWIFFRAQSLTEALFIIRNIFSNWQWPALMTVPGFGLTEIIFAVASIFVMESVHLLQRGTAIRDLLGRQSTGLRWAVYFLLVMAILLFGAYDNSRAFIYFQF